MRTVSLCALLVACVRPYPGPAPTAQVGWRDSVDAMPVRHGRERSPVDRLMIEQSATPTEPGRDYAALGPAASTIGSVENGYVVCHLRSVDPYARGTLAPDLRVELTLADRDLRFEWRDTETVDFSIGLVSLDPGDPIRVRVSMDRLGDDQVLLEAEEAYDGRTPFGWTDRPETSGRSARSGRRRTSLRCRISSTDQRDRLIDERLDAAWKPVRKNDPTQSTDRIRELAAILGWADPSVQFLMTTSNPDEPAR